MGVRAQVTVQNNERFPEHFPPHLKTPLSLANPHAHFGTFF